MPCWELMVSLTLWDREQRTAVDGCWVLCEHREGREEEELCSMLGRTLNVQKSAVAVVDYLTVLVSPYRMTLGQDQWDDLQGGILQQASATDL